MVEHGRSYRASLAMKSSVVLSQYGPCASPPFGFPAERTMAVLRGLKGVLPGALNRPVKSPLHNPPKRDELKRCSLTRSQSIGTVSESSMFVCAHECRSITAPPHTSLSRSTDASIEPSSSAVCVHQHMRPVSIRQLCRTPSASVLRTVKTSQEYCRTTQHLVGRLISTRKGGERLNSIPARMATVPATELKYADVSV